MRSIPVDSVLSLSQLNKYVSDAVNRVAEDGVWIVAEINSLQDRGHCYLELIEKDLDTDAIVAKANATIWRNVFVGLKMKFFKESGLQLSAGMKVLIMGKPTFHPQYGYSINITDIDPSYTVGDAALRRAAIVKRLKSEGVYDMNRTIPLPLLIKRIAVVSARGAAGYGDFMHHLESNQGGYKYNVKLFEAIMQGESAEASICEALDAVAMRSDEFDVVVIIRGGGALSDLSCFDKYELAFAVAQFPLPVLTGIGHDRDVSVVDEVACQMLKTPTAVAAFLIDSTMAQEIRINTLAQNLSDCVIRYIQTHQSQLDMISKELVFSVGGYIERHKHKLEMASQVIALTSPQNILKKGYSMTEYNGKVVTSASMLKGGDKITTCFFDGVVESVVDKKN